MLNKRGDLWIISDQDEFHYDILKGQDHTSAIVEFVRSNHLPLTIRPDDYHDGPCLLASIGYMVVKSEMDASLLIFYIPSIVNENQKNWFLDHRYLRMEYSKIGGYSLNQVWVPIDGFEAIQRQIFQKEKNFGLKN